LTYRDDVPRVSIAQIRTRFLPRVFRLLDRVEIEHGGDSCVVMLVHVPGHGTVTKARRLTCPRCERPALVLGRVARLGWACKGCGRWRSRNRGA